MSSLQSIRRNIGYQMVYRILTVITPLITSPILSRALGVEKLGVYSATLAFVNYFLLFAMLGVENYGTRTIAAARSDIAIKQKLFWNIYGVQFTAAFLSITAYCVALMMVERERVLIQLLQGIWLLAAMLDINWFYFGCEEFKLTVVRNIVVKLATVLAIVFFVHTPDDLLLYTVIMAGSMLVSQLVTWAALPRFISFEVPDWSEMKKHVRPVLKLFLPLLAFSVFHIMDKTMLDMLSDEKNLGYYYSADKLINIPLGVIYAVSTVMLPRISKVIHNGTMQVVSDMIEQSVELTVFLVSAVGFGLAAIAAEFVPFFFGSGYEPCVDLVYFFVPVLLVKACSNAVRSLFMIPAEKDDLYIVAVCCGAVTNLVCNAVLIIRYGAIGAVIGTFLAEFVTLGLQINGCRRELRFVRMFVKNSLYVLFGCIMFAAVRLLADWIQGNSVVDIMILIVCGAFVYLLCCMAYWMIKKPRLRDRLMLFGKKRTGSHHR